MQLLLVLCAKVNCGIVRISKTELQASQSKIHRVSEQVLSSQSRTNNSCANQYKDSFLAEKYVTQLIQAVCSTAEVCLIGHILYRCTRVRCKPCSCCRRVLHHNELILVRFVKVWCYHDLMLFRAYPYHLQLVCRFLLVHLLDGTPSFDGKVRNQRGILNRDVVLKSASDGDAVCVDDDDSENAFVRADSL